MILLQAPPPGPGNVWFIIGFVLIMVAVSALVAAAGDRMGHRAARRKLRIGKLRPRHVSTLIAIVTGMLITLLTVGVVFAVWSDFRNALLQYDNLMGAKAQLTEEIEAARADKAAAEAEAAEAREALTGATQQLEAQGVELEQKTAAITETRGKLTAAQTQLKQQQSTLAGVKQQQAAARARLAQVEQEYEQVAAQKAGDEIQLESMRGLRDKLREDVERYQDEIDTLEQEIARAEVGEQLIAFGTELGVVRVPAGQQAGLEQQLGDALAAIRADLAARGLDFDPGARAQVLAFLDALPADMAGADYLVIIRAAENVFTGGAVPLAFEAQPLAPLVRAGDVVLDILIGETTARITGLSGASREVSVPARFDQASLVELAVAAQQVFLSGARRAGFVPAGDGEIGSPVDRLPEIAAELISRGRPVRLQFVAKRSATAVDSLADASIHLTGQPAKTAPIAPPPVPEEEDAAEDDAPGDPPADSEAEQ